MNYFEVIDEIRSYQNSGKIKEGATMYVTFELQEGSEDTSTANRQVNIRGTLKYFPGCLNERTGKQMSDYLALDAADAETGIEMEINLSPVYIPVLIKSFCLKPDAGDYRCSFNALHQGNFNVPYSGEIIFINPNGTSNDWNSGRGNGLFLQQNTEGLLSAKHSFDIYFDSILISETTSTVAEHKNAA